MSKPHPSDRWVAILEALSDLTITVVADFMGDEELSGGAQVSIRLSELGVAVFPVGVVGEDESGQRILKALHNRRISTSGISKLKNFVTPVSFSEQTAEIHEAHPVLLNVVENARKLSTASDVIYVCDLGIGAASPRVLNFIKSKGSLLEKTLAARSLNRLVDFEQLTTAIATDKEVAQAIGIEIGNDEKKLGIAGAGILQAMHLNSLLAVSDKTLLAFEGKRKPARVVMESMPSAGEIHVIGAIFASAVATGADASEAAGLAAAVIEFVKTPSSAGKRIRREELITALTAKPVVRAR